MYLNVHALMDTLNVHVHVHVRDLPLSLQQGMGFGVYINIGGGQNKGLPSVPLNGTPCSFIL